MNDCIGITAILEDGLVQFPNVLRLHIGKAELSLPEEGIQAGINYALVALPGRSFDGGGGNFQPVSEKIRKERRILPCRLQFRYWLTILPLEFLQPSQSLPLVALHRNPQGNGLLSPLAALIIEVQHGGVSAIALN